MTEFNTPLNELLEKVPSTAEILLYKKQNLNINAQWIDWSINMLKAGYETENLIILAGEDLHCNPFEFAALTDKVFEELQLNEIDSNSIFIVYSIFIVKQALQSPDKNKIATALANLEQQCVDNEYNTFLYDFYLLSNALGELEELGEQWYWNDPSLTKENWYEYTLNYFKQWIENPSPQYEKLQEAFINKNCTHNFNPKKNNVFNKIISYIWKRLS